MKMKIDFVKETKVDGDVLYFTTIDGSFVERSLSYDFEKAKNMYELIVQNKGKVPVKQILITNEVNSDATEQPEKPYY